MLESRPDIFKKVGGNMKSRLLTFSLATLMCLTSLQSEAAKRLGGGQSVGRQSSNVTQREAARPAAPATPTQNQAAPAAQPAPAPAAAPAPVAAQPQRKPWGAMLGGLAAGLGLAWLAHSLGLGEAFGQILLFGLIALIVLAVVSMLLRRRNPGGSYAFQGAGPESAGTSPQYNPQNVGNDASARPWEAPTQFESTPPSRAGARIGSSLMGGSQNWSIPEGFDVVGFVEAAKANFITLQDAWDRSDINALRAMMTDEMIGEIRQQLNERESQSGGVPNKTEVVTLEAQLLGIEDLGAGFMASIEFTGLIREDQSAGPSPFREVWNMTRTKEGHDGWLVAGVQALQ
jgi:predicted lipid-binding transport protein (Tim44 family)